MFLLHGSEYWIMAETLTTQQKVARPGNDVLSCKMGRIIKMGSTMAEKRIQVREHLTLGGFMPPAHPILVACEKCGKCATLREFVFPPKPKNMVWRLGSCSCLHCGNQWMAAGGFHFFTKGPLWLKM